VVTVAGGNAGDNSGDEGMKMSEPMSKESSEVRSIAAADEEGPATALPAFINNRKLNSYRQYTT